MISFSCKDSVLSLAPHGASSVKEPRVSGAESRKGRTIADKDQLQTAGGLHQPCSQVHELLNHDLDPAPFCGMAHRRLTVNESDLPYAAEDVVRQSPQNQNQRVGSGFARRGSFHVKIGLDLSMELLAGPMVLVEQDNVLHRQIQGRPIALYRDFRDEEALSEAVDGAFHYPQHLFESVGLSFVDLLDMNSEQSNSFPCSRRDDLAILENPCGPFRRVFFPGIPDEFTLVVLTSFAQLKPQAPPFFTQVGRYGRIAVFPLVDSEAALFFSLGVTHAEHIPVKRYMPGLKRGDSYPGFLEELHRAGIGGRKERGCEFVLALAQSLGGREPDNTRGLPEILVFPAVRYRLEMVDEAFHVHLPSEFM